MFLILAREEIQNLKSSLVVWSRALRFPNRQQTVKRPKHTEKKKEIEEKIIRRKIYQDLKCKGMC